MLVDCGCKTVDDDLVGAWVKCNFLDVSNDLGSGRKEDDASSGEISNSKLLFVRRIRRHGGFVVLL
jgi:hypothetical protein